MDAIRILWFIIGFALLAVAKSAKILAIFPSTGYSQFILGEALICELAERGHNVTIISLFTPKACAEKCRTILTKDAFETMLNDIDWFQTMAGGNCFFDTLSIHQLGYTLTEYVLAHKHVQSLVNSTETFDLVIAEKFVNEAHMAFAKHFNAPLILFSSNGPSEWTHASVGNINLPSMIPISQAGLTNTMNFYQRFVSTACTVFDSLHWNFIVLPKQRQYVKKYFPGNVDLSDVLYNVSLVLLNSHVSTTETSSTVANMVEVGGLHIKPKQLPPDLKMFLDEATDGAILFSMGSNINSKNFPEDKMKAILKVFSRLSQRVLWKFEADLKDKPNNVLTLKWLPQTDVLAHPSIRLFITHGGLLSTTEAVYFGVPIVGIPIYGDQGMNVARAVKHGFAVRLPFEHMNEESFEKAIKEILNNPRYSIEAKKWSSTLKDQIVSPMERAIFWIEYVIRHKGAYHLRAASVDLYWYQLYLLDVAVAVILTFLAFILIVKYIYKLTLSPRIISNRDIIHCDTKKKQ